MDQRIINILLCDTFPGLLPESIPSHEYLFEKRFHSVNPNIIFKVYRTLDGELPVHPVPDEIYLITGSNNAAYDTLPWILDLQEWIRKAAARKIPLVGICIGHHILTFQGHPEFTVDYERHLILHHSENEDDAVKQRALESLDAMQPQGKVVAEFLMSYLG